MRNEEELQNDKAEQPDSISKGEEKTQNINANIR